MEIAPSKPASQESHTSKPESMQQLDRTGENKDTTSYKHECQKI